LSAENAALAAEHRQLLERLNTVALELDATRRALDQGFVVDTLSSDTSSRSVADPGYHLPLLMSKLMALGMSLKEVVPLVTSTPARYLGRYDEIGTLRRGAVAAVHHRIDHREQLMRRHVVVFGAFETREGGLFVPRRDACEFQQLLGPHLARAFTTFGAGNAFALHDFPSGSVAVRANLFGHDLSYYRRAADDARGATR